MMPIYVHNCLGLAGRGTVRGTNYGFTITPPPPQGTKKYLITCYFVCTVFPGANAAHSRQLFQQWMDNVVAMMTTTNTLVHTVTGQKEWGLFHNIRGEEFDQLTGLLSQVMVQWGSECTIHNHTCGRLYYVRGIGTGSLTITQHVFGPFQ